MKKVIIASIALTAVYTVSVLNKDIETDIEFTTATTVIPPATQKQSQPPTIKTALKKAASTTQSPDNATDDATNNETETNVKRGELFERLDNARDNHLLESAITHEIEHAVDKSDWVNLRRYMQKHDIERPFIKAAQNATLSNTNLTVESLHELSIMLVHLEQETTEFRSHTMKNDLKKAQDTPAFKRIMQNETWDINDNTQDIPMRLRRKFTMELGSSEAFDNNRQLTEDITKLIKDINQHIEAHQDPRYDGLDYNTPN